MVHKDHVEYICELGACKKKKKKKEPLSLTAENQT